MMVTSGSHAKPIKVYWFRCTNVNLWKSPALRSRGLNISLMQLSALINSGSWLQWLRVFTRDKPSKGRTVQCCSLKPASKPAWLCQAARSWTSGRLNTRRRGLQGAGVHCNLWAPTLVTRTPGADLKPPVTQMCPQRPHARKTSHDHRRDVTHFQTYPKQNEWRLLLVVQEAGMLGSYTWWKELGRLL